MVTVGQQGFVAQVSSGSSTDSAFGNPTTAASIGQLIGPPAVTLVASLGVAAGDHPDTSLGLMVCLRFSALATPAYFSLGRTDAGLRNGRHRTAAGPVSLAKSSRRQGGAVPWWSAAASW